MILFGLLIEASNRQVRQLTAIASGVTAKASHAQCLNGAAHVLLDVEIAKHWERKQRKTFEMNPLSTARVATCNNQNGTHQEQNIVDARFDLAEPRDMVSSLQNAWPPYHLSTRSFNLVPLGVASVPRVDQWRDGLHLLCLTNRCRRGAPCDVRDTTSHNVTHKSIMPRIM